MMVTTPAKAGRSSRWRTKCAETSAGQGGPSPALTQGFHFLYLRRRQRVCIKTSTLDEKLNGIQMILTLSKALGAHYAPYVEASFKVLLPLISRYLDDNCRIVAGACVGPLLQSLREAKAGVSRACRR